MLLLLAKGGEGTQCGLERSANKQHWATSKEKKLILLLKEQKSLLGREAKARLQFQNDALNQLSILEEILHHLYNKI